MLEMQNRAVTYSGRDFCLSLILASGLDLVCHNIY